MQIKKNVINYKGIFKYVIYWCRKLICKHIGHRFNRVQCLVYVTIPRTSVLNRKGRKKRPIKSTRYKSMYMCTRCGLVSSKLRKGEKVHESNK